MKKATMIILAAALLTNACIVGESTHHIYLDREGRVTWVVHEMELRSISGPDEYKAEEDRFLAEARLGLHPVAQAFALLSPIRLDYQVQRADRPFEIRTEAHFDSIEGLTVDLLRQLGIDGTVSLLSEDEVTKLEILIENPCDDADLPDDGIIELADELTDYRLLMTEGRFVDAVGFELLEEGAVAIPIEADIDCEHQADRALVLSLSWGS